MDTTTAIDPQRAWQALAARDARFDGRLYVGVTSTGIYCRPICRVRTPRRENCRFFATAAQAEAASFRPCLKCRPEIAPGPGLAWSVMDASRTLALQAATAIDAAVAAGRAPSVVAVARRLGVTDRHLRRIFAAAHGVTPMQYVQTRRLLLAKQMLTDTGLPVAQVALHCGFDSVRRFNAAFAAAYRLSPTRLRDAALGPGRARAARPRRAAPDAGDTGATTLLLGYRTPYDRAGLLRFFARRAIPGIEAVEAASVRRSVPAGLFGAAAGWIEAAFGAGDDARVRLRIADALVPHAGAVVAAARRWLDLDAAPDVIDATLAALPGAPGTRLPGGPDRFEIAVRAVLGQQVSVGAARTLARRLVQRYGAAVQTPWPEIGRTFPSPAALAAVDASEVAALGIVGTRARAIVALAAAWPAIDALAAPGADPAALIDALVALPGIGAWTAHYIAMRALGWPDAFPPGDVAARRALRLHLAAAGAPNAPRDLARAAEAWSPWRAYALLRLWNSLETNR